MSASTVCLSAPFWHPANTPSAAVAESVMLGGRWCCVTVHRAARPSDLAQGSALTPSSRCSCCWHGCFPERDGGLRLPHVHTGVPLWHCRRPRGGRSSRPCGRCSRCAPRSLQPGPSVAVLQQMALELQPRGPRAGRCGAVSAAGSPSFTCSECSLPLAGADRISARADLSLRGARTRGEKALLLTLQSLLQFNWLYCIYFC